MKRVITITLVMMLVLTLALEAYGDTQSTEVTFEVNSTYKLYIPPTATIVKDENTGAGTGSMSISFSECHVNGINIQLEANDNYNAGWYLRGTQAGDMIPYTISCQGNDNVFPDDNLFVSRDLGLVLQLKVNSENLKKAMGDTYRDRLIFKFQ